MQNHLFVSLALATGLLAIGCSDPAEKVHKSTTSAPKETPPAAVASTAPAVAAAQSFPVRAESTVGFFASKVTGSHNGGFKSFEGAVSVADGKVVVPTEIKIAMASTWTDTDRLTGHLKSPDFFDVAKNPISTFTVTSIEPADAGHKVTGNLALHGVTKSISFPATLQVSPDAVKVKAEFAINRRDFNINYSGMANDLIRDNVVIKLDVTATPGAPRPQDQLPK